MIQPVTEYTRRAWSSYQLIADIDIASFSPESKRSNACHETIRDGRRLSNNSLGIRRKVQTPDYPEKSKPAWSQLDADGDDLLLKSTVDRDPSDACQWCHFNAFIVDVIVTCTRANNCSCRNSRISSLSTTDRSHQVTFSTSASYSCPEKSFSASSCCRIRTHPVIILSVIV